MSSVALARIYQKSFESHPHYTLAVTNGTLNALGDVVAQSVQLLVRPLRTHFFPTEGRGSPPHHSRQTHKKMNILGARMTLQERCASSYLDSGWVRQCYDDPDLAFHPVD